VIIVIVILAVGRDTSDVPPAPHQALADAINIDRLFLHLNALQNIANANNGSRTAITGYNASVAYVMQQLAENTNYQVTTQEFIFLMFKQLAPPTFNLIIDSSSRAVPNTAFQGLRYCGSGKVSNATVQSVNGGCLDTDYNGFLSGNVALISRGQLLDCNMTVKIENAVKYNASGAIVTNDPGSVGLFSTGLDKLAPFPAFAVTYDFGQTLLELLPGLKVSMTSLTEAPPTLTMNVLARSDFGDPNKPMIVVGSHLDSVLAGPGINDNGSGTSTNLELAIQSTALGLNFKNRILFAWWAAEEFGLLGSRYFVNSLTPEGKADIVLNLNYDMIASPNFYRGIYNGSSGKDDVKAGSGKIQAIFQEFFDNQQIATELKPFDGRSDYGPFIEVGIPAGGLAAGAEVIKTAAGRTKYGGYANVAYDPCYHLECDTIDNVNQEVLIELAKGAAYTLGSLADQDDLKGFLNS